MKAVREIVDQFVRWYMGGTWVLHSDRELTRPAGGGTCTASTTWLLTRTQTA